MHHFSLILGGERPPIQILVIQFSNEQSIASLFDQIYNDTGSGRRRASAIVIRPCVDEHFTPVELDAAVDGKPHKASAFLAAVTEAHAESNAFARFEDIPVFVLHSDNFVHRLGKNINVGAPAPPLVESHLADPTTISAIRSSELNHLITRSNALLVPVEGAYYDPPSHRPTRSFLRIGNIQYSRQAVDALVFWLLPHLAQARGLLIDTWSISSIAFNVSRVLTLYDGRPPIPVEMLSRYQDRSPEAQAILFEVLDRLSDECALLTEEDTIPITCIVSATQSGSLVNVLREEIELASLPIDMRFVALFQLGKTDALPSLCDRSDDPGFKPLSPESLEKRSAIHIDPQVYFPLAYQDIEFNLRKSHAKNFTAFIKRFGREGIFSTHRDQASDGAPRHHAIHIDTAALIATPSFQAVFDDEIRALEPRPAVILTPQHDVARTLGERAIAILGAEGHQATHLQHPSLMLREQGPARDAEAYIRSVLSGLSIADGMLILDDCFITGDRLSGYVTRLRQHEVRARLHYLVAVARPEDMAHWEEQKMVLRYRDDSDKERYAENTVGSIATLCLPNWQKRDCPWCAELALYTKMLELNQDLPAGIEDRICRLKEQDAGLVNDLFLVAPNEDALKLYSGSIFVPSDSSQATVFAAVASAVQHLRTARSGAGPELGPRRYPIATIIRARDYLKNIFTDSILRAAVLRAACAEELVYMNVAAESRRTGLVAALLTSDKLDERDLASELILAHASGKCTIDAEFASGKLGFPTAQLLDNIRALEA